MPTEDAQRPERVPSARLTHRFVEPNGERLVVRVIEEPPAIGLPRALNDAHGLPGAHVGLNTGVREVVQRAEGA